MSVTQRKQSFFYEMRKFHNQVKRDLYREYSSPRNTVLELGIGKGGDLSKWIENDFSKVVGYDIDPVSVEEAHRRVLDSRQKIPFTYDFQVRDLSTTVVPSTDDKYDLVSAMFSFHYFFANQKSFETITTTILSNLKVGGFFIGTMFDGRSVLKNKIPSNQYFEIQLKPETDTQSFFGKVVSVRMGSTVLDQATDEFVVEFNEFVTMMKKFGLDLVESRMFESLYDSTKFKMGKVEKAASFLNRTFVFVKRVI
jgi:mRNA (guanine-N7-)-methyltransferase